MTYALNNEDIFQFIMKDELLLEAIDGIYPIDKLPMFIHPAKFYIINSDPSFLPGRHWMNIFSPYGSHPEFFDSLGRAPSFYSDAIPKFLGKKYVYNSIRLQPPNSSTCGLYCLYYVYHRLRGLTFSEILDRFSRDLEHNDAVVIDFYRSFE